MQDSAITLDKNFTMQGLMPASMLQVGRSMKIVRINGRDKTRNFLAGLGFIEGSELTVISEIDGNVIFKVKETRVALGKEMAARILVG